MQDKTFKQAIEEVSQTFTEQVFQEAQRRLNFFQDGQTIVEVTADISQPALRKAVAGCLFFLYIDALSTSLYRLDIVNQKQADELHEYLSRRFAPLPIDAFTLFLSGQE